MLQTIAYLGPLFADRGEMLRDLGGGFRGERAKLHADDVILVILGGALIGVLFWLLSHFVRSRERRASYYDPKQLFRKLAAAHQLSFGERRLLLLAARYANLPLAACLFLRPDLFEVAAAHPELAGRSEQLFSIKQKLFGGGA